MDIALDETETGGRYHAVVDGHTSEMTFSKAGASMIIIDHTDVPEALRGQGRRCQTGGACGAGYA